MLVGESKNTYGAPNEHNQVTWEELTEELEEIPEVEERPPPSIDGERDQSLPPFQEEEKERAMVEVGQLSEVSRVSRRVASPGITRIQAMEFDQ